MDKTIEIYWDEEGPTPEWVIELQKQHREDMAKVQAEVDKIAVGMKELKADVNTVNELLKSSNELMASGIARLQYSNELMDYSNALMASSNALMSSSNALMASSNALMDSANNRLVSATDRLVSANDLLVSSNALMASSNAKMESSALKHKSALEEMDKIQQNIHETKLHRAEVDEYWKDLINKEIEKRSKCRRGRPRKLICNESSTKRLRNVGGSRKHAQTKKLKK